VTLAGLPAGHIAAVTGGGSWIGRGICQARAGARIIVLDLNLVGAKEIVDLIESAGGNASAMKLDATNRDTCEQVAAQISKDYNISILVNNAGINRRNHTTAEPAAVTEDRDDILASNPHSMFNVTHAFLHQLRATRGRIINIGSIQSFVHIADATWLRF
jgi:NAD(P)-dependent dehydrogenase (short-subunit alcohol dehydrogenase family)